MREPYERIERALAFAAQYGQIDGDHHKAWAIDQMVRALLDCPVVQKEAKDYRGNLYTYAVQGKSDDYTIWVHTYSVDNYGDEWDEGIAP